VTGRRPLDAVTFDFWNTLAWDDHGAIVDRRVNAWGGLLEELGADVGPDAVRAAVVAAHDAHAEHWHAGRQFLARDGAELALDHLAVELDDEASREQLLVAFGDVGRHAELELAPGIEDCLATLAGAGLRIAIVCDVGFTAGELLRDFLERAGLLHRFGGWAFSDEVGHYKPAAEMFDHALGAIGQIDPARAAHVGDLRRTDVAGARAYGMTAVRYAGLYDDPPLDGAPEGHHVVTDHRELATVLGLV
jgi:FMN phosphatase YigB (HAD superfamily)